MKYDNNIFFLHPENENLKIHVFADAPHLIKLLRNHFLDHDFTSDGVTIDRTCLEKLLKASNSDLKMAYKLSRYHLDVKGTERQKVWPAVQIFSNQVSKAIDWCGRSGFLEGTT